MSRRVRKHPHAGMVGTKHAFVKLVGELARGGRSHGEVFGDFLELSFCALVKTTLDPAGERAAAMEARYMRTVEKRDAAYIRRMPELLGLLQLGVFEGCDFLGEVSGELGSLNEHMGQFFTPYAVSAVNAQLLIDKDVVENAIVERGYLTLQEPACGAGGMVLATADVLYGMGFDACQHMRVWAIDLSETAFRMAYVQLSLRGLAAHVLRGDTLRMEMHESQVTPGLLLQDMRLRSGVVDAVRSATAAVDALASESTTDAPLVPVPACGQLDLFAGVG